jgi:hypothetical protein
VYLAYIGLAFAVVAPVCGQTQPPSKAAAKSKPDSSGEQEPEAPKTQGAAGQPQPDAAKTVTAPDAGPDAAEIADPSQTRKIIANEIFRDPKAIRLLDIDRYKHIIKPPVAQGDINALKAMAGDINANIDTALIERVVDAMASKLTDHANLQALIDPPARPSPTAARAIQEATTSLLEPVFLAKTAKNTGFLTSYNRVLQQRLAPLLANHLVARVQAMIVMGQSGSQELLGLYLAQIKDPNQTVWVKLWALEGIVNMAGEGARLTGQEQVAAAKIIADFLEKEDDAPWPAQIRGLEALGAMRQGFEPNKPKPAAMANAAMKFLADPEARLEVRAEAARALGLMPITAAVPKYNHNLVAHAIGSLAADMAAEIGDLVPTPPVRAATKKAQTKGSANKAPAETAAATPLAKPAAQGNLAKAKYYAALLVGPIFQAFDGVQGLRESGLLHSATGQNPAYAQKVFDLVKASDKAALELIYAGSRQIDDRKKDLETQVAALRDFLDKNAPADRHLVPDGVEYPLPQAQPAAEPAG